MNASHPFQKLRSAIGFSMLLMPGLAAAQNGATASSENPQKLSGASFTNILGTQFYKQYPMMREVDSMNEIQMKQYLSSYTQNVKFIGNGTDRTMLTLASGIISQNAQNTQHNIVNIRFHGRSQIFINPHENTTKHDCELFLTEDENWTSVENFKYALQQVAKDFNHDASPDRENTFILWPCEGAEAIEATAFFQGHNDMCVFMADQGRNSASNDEAFSRFLLSRKGSDPQGELNRDSYMNALLEFNAYYLAIGRNFPVITFKTPQADKNTYETHVINMCDEFDKFARYPDDKIMLAYEKTDNFVSEERLKSMKSFSQKLSDGTLTVREVPPGIFKGIMQGCYYYALAYPGEMPTLNEYLLQKNYVPAEDNAFLNEKHRQEILAKFANNPIPENALAQPDRNPPAPYDIVLEDESSLKIDIQKKLGNLPENVTPRLIFKCDGRPYSIPLAELLEIEKEYYTMVQDFSRSSDAALTIIPNDKPQLASNLQQANNILHLNTRLNTGLFLYQTRETLLGILAHEGPGHLSSILQADGSLNASQLNEFKADSLAAELTSPAIVMQSIANTATGNRIDAEQRQVALYEADTGFGITKSGTHPSLGRRYQYMELLEAFKKGQIKVLKIPPFQNITSKPDGP